MVYGQDLVIRDQKHYRREHLRYEYERQEGTLAFEVESRDAISGKAGYDRGDDHRPEDYDDAVPEV